MSDRYRVWAAILYPDSAPEDWLSILNSVHVPMAISPLHEPDDEEVKKHWHCLLNFDGKKSIEQVKQIINRVNGAVLPFPIESIGGYARYLCHIDDEDKEQLNVSDVICLGGFDYNQYLVPSKTKTKEIIHEIDEFVLDNLVTEVCDLLEYALKNEPEWYGVLQVPAQFSRYRNLTASMRHQRSLYREEVKRDLHRKEATRRH